IAGSDRVLGRWAVNRGAPIEQQFQNDAFFAAALDLPIGPRVPVGNDPSVALADALTPFVQDHATRRAALEALSFLLSQRAATEPEAFQPLIRRMLEANDPSLNIEALARLNAIRKSDLDFAKPFVLQGLATPKSGRVPAAAGALRAFPDAEFARAAFEDVS